MKKIFTMCVMMATMLSTNLYATYYVAGNGAYDPNENWVHGQNWEVAAEVNALDANGTITFTNVAGGYNFGFKITDGQWGAGHEFTTIDYENCDAPMYGGNGSDIGFVLSEAGDVTISLVDGKIRLTATKPLAYRSNYYYIAGNGSDARGTWCNQKNWNSKDAGSVLVDDQISFTALPAEWYEFKITKGNWDNIWGYTELNVAASSPMHKTYGDGNNICFRLQSAADVTIKIVKNQVVLLIDREYCITGNGEDAGNGAWLAGHNWYAQDADNKLDANLSRTYSNLPAGTYKFKVKENTDSWHDDCTFGFAQLDTDNSITCSENGSNNVQFVLDSPKDVTIALVNNKIRVTAKEPSSPTAIENVNFKNDGAYYNVLGQKVTTLQPGNIYIHNGKKILF